MVRTLATTVSTDVLVVTVVLVETVVPQEARAGLLVMVATVVLALLVVLVAPEHRAM